MSLLKEIAPSVQQVAEAIAIAIGVEVEIVDNQLTIVGGTAVYTNRIGQKEEAGELDGNYLYARVLRSGMTEYVADAISDQYYGNPGDGYNELAEICTPIKSDNQIIGIIGLVALNEQQKAILLDKNRSMVTFVEKMADLLAAKVMQKVALNNIELSMNEMATVLETTHEGIFAIDSKGYIRHCNYMAEELFKTTKDDMIGSHISKFMRGTPALEVLRSGNGYTENEEVYTNDRGSFHFIVTAKPFFTESKVAGVVISFRDIEEAQKLVYNINTRALKYTFDDIMGESEAIRRAKNQSLITARGNSTVLITGESGTGKEMFAKAIHYSSSRAKGPFITVNCGAIPENLLESELFGYEKGAFTGANDKGKFGKFELANGGTIFLDEIGDMPLHLQVKILHVLQNMRFERVGGNKVIIVDVRVIAATNKDLEEMIREGTFREDLYYRLSVIPLTIPPLRGRRSDIKLLMYHFLNKYNTFMNKKIKGFTEEVERLYESYDWPGNVRELENAVEYGTNMAFGDTIGIDAVPARLLKDELNLIQIEDSDLPLSEQVRFYEKEILLRKLKKYGSNSNAKDRVAKELGLSRATLYRKLAELDIK
ncbi:sigma 54-interacting transcriptional regulator [Sinanaerobacter chloroacetimidivorans]|uniref:Sigma 54-interacting transcriptional regulator n=1 Tax=Sinanaerobacter chloroacetimidivorans TaxID=2818044 RepID=A0A8J8B0Z3_9FIRM|nr:sigma 54-interacting transcriptional regulator [Sinanaerobacter chloroacetimidivorans]MBR0597131.1 sigma 54-interacting transcriptional regulator [Sinanaerobacter chloroacetimidivorans]